MKNLIVALCVFTLFACGGDDEAPEVMEVTCPTEVEYAFRVTVRNGADNSLLEDVSIEAIDQAFSEILVVESPGIYVGPEERAGSYQLIITKDNFQTIITSEESREEDDCGLITKPLEFTLDPL